MKTDVIQVSSKGSGMEAALSQAEKAAAYKGLSAKGALHLRLLTEEMMGMMRGITGETKGEFWIEDEDSLYRLHLRTATRMDLTKREQLLAASTSGKNEAARGLMGRLRDFFDQGADTAVPSYLFGGEMAHADSFHALDYEWSLERYQRQLEMDMPRSESAKDLWDELEKSVVTHVADNIKVSIRGSQAEMIIEKEIPA